ncbi:unnamed protein product, partial [Schistocephalus solidus]|uniref:DNA repair nuclease/redox regulator APEX1 n=1 Tax=Schistocephalus solidus TaxID=70667 RepID=A0A183TD65_SCHSO
KPAVNSAASLTKKHSSSWTFKCVTWNVNGLRAWIKNGGLNYVLEEQPDVIGLQEIKCQLKDIPNAANLSEFKSYWFPADKPGYAGTGLYSKAAPITVKHGIGIKEHDNEGRTITAEYDKFFLITTYVPNSGRGLVRLKYRTEHWDKAFCEYVKQLDKKKPVIVSGDLNVAHEEIDLKNPDGNHKTAGFTDEERKSFTRFLADADLVDTYRHFYPNRRDAYTFWSTMKNARVSNSGWRLDYFLVSRRFLSHVVDQEFRCGVLGSDHCPVVTYIKL